MIRAFETSFVTQYQTAFTELVRLGSVAAQKRVEGKETSKEDSIAQRLFIVLQALDSDGLSAKQVDALEYCLLRLNESLSGPTVEALVSVSAPTVNPVDKILRAWMESYTMTMQDVVMRVTRSLAAGVGSFTYSGENATLRYSRNPLLAGVGSFLLTGNPATLTYTEIPHYRYEINLNSAEAPISWRVTFDDGVLLKTYDVSGVSDFETEDYKTVATSVLCTVWKTNNGGIVQYSGNVQFLLNSVLVTNSTMNNGDNLDGSGTNYKQHTFTALSPSDQLAVIINEV